MSECTTSSCSTEDQETKSQDCECPVEKAVCCWSDSFAQAKKEVAVEILKDRIRKAWGPQMEKVGDAVVEAMGEQFKASLQQGKAHLELREKIKNVFLEVIK